VQWSLGSTAVGLWLRKNCSDEHRSDATRKKRTHQRVSRAANSKVKLTVALDGARAQQRPRNRHWSSAGGGGAPCSRGQSEREGERVGQRAQMREEGWASRTRGSKGARAHGHGRRTRGRGRIYGVEIVGGRLRTADRWGRRDRERSRCACERTTPIALAHGAARERESERSGLRRQAGLACQAQGARGGAGLNGLVWAEMAFSFFLEFLLPFLFIFSRVFNSNSNQVSNSNQMKYVQQFKEYLGLI
jgi:hypothetical protein